MAGLSSFSNLGGMSSGPGDFFGCRASANQCSY